jgi:hypothetical protein
VDEGVLEAARAVRPYLTTLVGDATADDLDMRIAVLLAAASQEDVTERLCELLNANEATAAFLEEVLADSPNFRPPDMQPQYIRPVERGPGGIERLAGDIGVVLHAGRYACPKGDFVWYRPAVGAAIPACPTHGPGLTES